MRKKVQKEDLKEKAGNFFFFHISALETVLEKLKKYD